MAGRGAGLVDHAATASGARRSRCGRATTPRYPRVDVYGSLDELGRDFGVRPDDLHRPAIDELTRPNPDDPTGASTMRRVTDVLDCWFESGSMPFAQLHYPFENAQRFEEHFPADFIFEYVGQTRGWFYTLHVLGDGAVRPARLLRPASPTASCSATTAASSRSGCATSPTPRSSSPPTAPTRCAGTCSSSPVLRGHDVIIENKGDAPNRSARCCNPIWNTWYFLSLYAQHRRPRRARCAPTSRACSTATSSPRRDASYEDVTAAMDSYDLAGACGYISAFFDALTNWYVRRSRDRFWRPVDAAGPAGAGTKDGAPDDKHDAYDTLHTVLEVLCRVAAPLLPFLAEAVYRASRAERSVHLRPLARGRRAPGRPRARRGDGPRPRGVLGGPLDPQGLPHPRPACRCRH